MLSSETKRHIDGARQVLVGIVPDPKGQVDQITNALIYKFMDDMDQSAIKADGKPSFFVKDLEKYSWTRLMSSQLGNQDRMNLYVEAIAKFGEAEQLPELFRDIFRRAFLPYRDPETLGLFLKEISYFSYSHSEELGNAYEYLLSILGSQGDAGQFRTPRHIIDFMVAVVDPTKEDTVLDPACGTAGFLISAYKHILAKHDGKDNQTGKSTKHEKLLTPDERRKVMEHFTGYDISPDMVRMSQVNMYLHSFKKPRIYEYNTLASEDRWNEKFDVMLANPPFMSPQGGVRPHNKFSVESSRAEVLFVDYIMTHLKPRGRGGIIVPAGIIFQSGSAYKKLRKLLIEDGLYAVVSLPSGVFNPYSGVKTSILFFDNQCAPKSESVLFVDIKNTGLDLGASKREIEGSDLPEALRVLQTHRVAVLEGKEVPKSSIAFPVKRSAIEKTGDYSFAVEKYKIAGKVSKRGSEIPYVSLGDISRIERGKSSSTKTPTGPYPLVLTAEEHKTSSHFDFEGEAVCVPLISATGHGKANLKRVHRISGKFALANLLVAIFPDKDVLDPDYLYWTLTGGLDQLASLMNGAANVGMKPEDVSLFKIPLPSIETQRKMVDELNNNQQIISGAEKILINYKPRFKVLDTWKKVELKTLCSVEGGSGFPLDYQGKKDGKYPFLKVSDMNLSGNEVNINSWNNSVSEKEAKELKVHIFPKSTIVFPKVGGAIATNKKRILSTPSIVDNNIMGLIPNDPEIGEYLYFWLLGFDIAEWASNSVPPSIRKTTVEEFVIPFPTKDERINITAGMKIEQERIESVKSTKDLFEEKVRSRLIEIWNV